MKLLTRDTDYAINALCYIATSKKKVVSVPELVHCLKIPRPFLRKILQILNKEGLLISYKGQGGGFKLALSPKKIFLIDLVNVFQGPIKLSDCLRKKKRCNKINICPLREKIDSVEKYIVSEFETITMASLIKNGDWPNGKKKNN